MEGTVREVATFFGIRESSLRTLVRKKIVKTRKSGGIILVDKDSVRSFLNNKK